MLHHQQPVANADPEGASAAPLAQDQSHDWNPSLRQRHQVFRDRPRDAPLLRPGAGKCTGGINEGNDRKLEALRLSDQSKRLSVALGVRHAEIAHRPFGCRPPLLLSDDHDRPMIEGGRAADDGMVVTEEPVAVQLEEVAEDRVDVIEGIGAVGMAGELDLLPGRSRDRSVVGHPRTAGVGADAFARGCNSKSLATPFLM